MAIQTSKVKISQH